MEGGGEKGVHLKFFENVFFHCGKAREGKGVMFFTKSLWAGERVHWGKRCRLIFFLLFFTVEGEGGGVNVFFFP